MLGLAALPGLADRAIRTIGALTSTTAGTARFPRTLRLLIGGALWGCTPCSMVYGTLFRDALRIVARWDTRHAWLRGGHVAGRDGSGFCDSIADLSC